MELNREHFCAIIFYNFRRGLTQQQCIDELNSIFGNEATSRTRVYRWHGEFNPGYSSLQDEFPKGRRKSVVVPETIDGVRQLILQDRHVTYCEIETTLVISGTSIHSILNEHLTVKKICSTDFLRNFSWQFYLLPEIFTRNLLRKSSRRNISFFHIFILMAD